MGFSILFGRLSGIPGHSWKRAKNKLLLAISVIKSLQAVFDLERAGYAVSKIVMLRDTGPATCSGPLC